MTEQLKKDRVPERTSEPTPAFQPCTRSFFTNSCDMLTPHVAEPYQQHDPLFDAFDPNFTFGSEAANLEYSILSAILGNPSPSDSGTAPSPSQHQQASQSLANSTWSPEPLHAQPQYMQGSPSGFGSPYGDRPQLSIPHTDGITASQPSPTFLSSYPSSQLGPRPPSPAPQYPHPYAQPQPHLSAPPLAAHYSHGLISLGPSGLMRTPSRDARSRSYESSGHTSPSPTIQSGDHHSVRVYVIILCFAHNLPV